MENKSPVYDCHVNTNEEGDTYVGIKYNGEKIHIGFPLGYNLGKTEAHRKKDIWLLIRVLSRFSGYQEKSLPQLLMQNPETVNFPIHAYLNVLEDYYSRGGYYTETDIVYRPNSKRPPHWAKTIRAMRAYPQDNSFIYLKTVARETIIDLSNMITRINRFCVEEAYNKIGWLFTPQSPQHSDIIFQEIPFMVLLQKKLTQTNNEKNKLLFSSMIDIIRYVGKRGQNTRFHFGTENFEYVWEKLIDYNFGIRNKEQYFPGTYWHLGETGFYANSHLEPDTIMIANGKVFILDAKYYKFGATANPSHLPKSASINKQITYGEYVATETKFWKKGIPPTVYNVFIMPYNSKEKPFKSGRHMVKIGEARGEWKISGAEYERIQGVLLDVKWLMSNAVCQNPADISELAELVEVDFTLT